MNNNFAVFPGSFNPFHAGHRNIIEQASKLFSKIYVVRFINPNKSIDKSYEFIVDSYKLNDCEIVFVPEIQNCSVFDWCYNNDINYVIRGIRNQIDANYEYEVCKVYKEAGLYPIIFMADPLFKDLSSTIIRNGGNLN